MRVRVRVRVRRLLLLLLRLERLHLALQLVGQQLAELRQLGGEEQAVRPAAARAVPLHEEEAHPLVDGGREALVRVKVRVRLGLA